MNTGIEEFNTGFIMIVKSMHNMKTSISREDEEHGNFIEKSCSLYSSPLNLLNDDRHMHAFLIL